MRGRGELRADVNFAEDPVTWTELSAAIGEISTPGQAPPPYYRLKDLGSILEQHLEQLIISHSERNS